MIRGIGFMSDDGGAFREASAGDERAGVGRFDQKLKRDQMAEYFHQRRPGQHGAGGDGKLDFDEVVKLAEKYMRGVAAWWMRRESADADS